jgi:hypothetical protein
MTTILLLMVVVVVVYGKQNKMIKCCEYNGTNQQAHFKQAWIRTYIYIYIYTYTHKQKCDVTSRETVWIYSERYIWTEGSQTNQHILPTQVQKKSFFFSLEKNVSRSQGKCSGFTVPTQSTKDSRQYTYDEYNSDTPNWTTKPAIYHGFFFKTEKIQQ